MRVFSGVQPSGQLHVGNYFGAIAHFAELQRSAQCLFCVVDLHALTVPADPAELRAQSLRVAAAYLACGIDPTHSIVFIQSHVPQHSELAWLLGCVATFGELARMTQFKDKSAGRASVSLGLFAYPALMAADILLYRATAVPVGDDQRQHLELCRDVAERFNGRFGETFPLPEALIGQVGRRIMSLQDPLHKMSKTDPDPAGRIDLLDSPETIRGRIRRAVTDSGRDVRYDPAAKPAISNLLEIMSLVTDQGIPALEARYGDAGYGRFKADLAEAVVARLEPIQARFGALMSAVDHVQAVLAAGAQRAAALAEPTMADVRQRMGLLARSGGVS